MLIYPQREVVRYVLDKRDEKCHRFRGGQIVRKSQYKGRKVLAEAGRLAMGKDMAVVEQFEKILHKAGSK